MKFDTYLPSDRLKPYVKQLVISENAVENTYKVFPSTSLVIRFQYQGHLKNIIDGTEKTLAIAAIQSIVRTLWHQIKSNNQTMFTLEQIRTAHSKVKSGADFPSYIQEIKALGVTYYEAFVTDGHIDYFGENSFQISAPAKYESLLVADICNAEQFKADLLAHQQGKTDYPTFCNDCAKSGIEKWAVYLEKMTCTYFDKANNEILVEQIPEK